MLLSLSPWRLWREHLTRHLVVSGSCHLSLGVLSKEEKTNKEKRPQIPKWCQKQKGIGILEKKKLGSASKWVKP
jgi:hypothetical protein